MRLKSILALVISAAAFGACGDSTPVDPDMTATPKVPSVPIDFDVEDSIDGAKDKVDFKILNARKDGKATISVKFADDHKVSGTVGVLGSDGSTNVKAKIVSEGESEYVMDFDVKDGDTYYLKVSATKGKAKYTVNFSIEETVVVVDPCAGVECSEEEECKEGKCVEIPPAVCSPACRGGLVCIGGECVKPCGGTCPKGQLCNRTRNECVRDPCYQKTCAAGEKCVGGTCRPTTVAPTAKQCNPACAAGQTCNTTSGKCEGTPTDVTPPADNCAGPLNGSIVQVLPQGAKSVLVINRGSKVCVKVGQTGRINGVNGAFKITEVYEFRSKGVIDVDDKTIGANRSVTINR
jgi:hypothetical protein